MPAAADAPAVILRPSGWLPGPSIPSELEERIRRDLGRARRVALLIRVATIACLILGLVSIRQAALLVAIDRDLATTEEVQALGTGWDVVRLVLLAALVGAACLAIRWLRGALPVFEELRERGVVAGPAPGPGMARVGLMWRGAGVPAELAGWADLRVAGGRRNAAFAGAAVVVAAGVGLVAALGIGAAADAEASRLFRAIAGVAAALAVLAGILVGAAIDTIAWREAVAARALGVFIPLVDAPGRTLFRVIPAALVFAASVLVVSGRPEPWFVPCPQATLECGGLLVPADHDGGSGATIWIAYAVHRAASRPLGTLAIAVGGPGASGLASAVPAIDRLDPELVRRYDILFWDQRGIGASEGHDCPIAGLGYGIALPGPATARIFAEACLRESRVDPSRLPQYATRQAAEDLESLRDHLGIERFALYGESYGTELAQIYAARHPDRLTTLILDGAVDLTRSSIEFWADAAHGFEAVLSDTFAACSADAACRDDVADPAAEYRRALGRFATPRDVSYGDPDGVVRPHTVTASGIEAAVGTLLYEPAGRMLIQRAIAASARGESVPLARLVAAVGSGGISAVSTFAYHAILCADYRVSPTADPGDVASVEQAAKAAGVTRLRTDEVFTAQYPCLFWPFQPADGTRPAALTTTPFPVFVLGSTGDPITPIGQARTIAGRLTDGYLVETRGGPHVTFGRGETCVDQPIVDFLLREVRPASRSMSCFGEVASPYIPLDPTTAAGYEDALDVMIGAEDELFTNPDYLFWPGTHDLQVGCRHGGFIAITPATLVDNLRFAECAVVPDLALTGSGTYSFDGGLVRWTVRAADGELEYAASGDLRRVTGTWQGEEVDISR